MPCAILKHRSLEARWTTPENTTWLGVPSLLLFTRTCCPRAFTRWHPPQHIYSPYHKLTQACTFTHTPPKTHPLFPGAPSLLWRPGSPLLSAPRQLPQLPCAGFTPSGFPPLPSAAPPCVAAHVSWLRAWCGANICMLSGRNTVHWPPGAGCLHIYSGIANNAESKEEKKPDKIKACYQV